VLAEHGARGAVAAELLAYDRNIVVERGLPPLPQLPLADEEHVGAWRDYASSAEREGHWVVLQRTFPQLRFPIRAGISQESAYRSATLSGGTPGKDARGLELLAPESLELHLHPSLAGTVPVIVAGRREDFVSLVQAFCYRNEPRDVPASMGACHVSGYNNWDRIHRHRRRWESEHPGRSDESAWREEFARLRERKAEFQDRFVILSRGPYSAVSAGELGMTEDDWLERSLVIRRDHECTHAFTLRVFGALGKNLLEELIADYVGLIGAFGRYRADLARRFLGLEGFPAYREGGRLENYRGTPPLSVAAFASLVSLANAAITSLERWDSAHPGGRDSTARLSRSAFVLNGLTLEELAYPGCPSNLEGVLARLPDAGV
jgi:hypothetical protein